MTNSLGFASNTWTDFSPGKTFGDVLAIGMEAVTVGTTNYLPALSQTPSGDLFLAIVNGRVFTPADANAPFGLQGNQIIWGTGPFGVNPGDIVTAVYTYLAPAQ